MTESELIALSITLRLALISTLILLLAGLPLALWLSGSRSVAARLTEAVISLPLVLPPTVIGFYLLIAFAPSNFFGSTWLHLTGRPLAFSFSGLVIGSVIFSLPFVVQPMQSTFEQQSRALRDCAATLGAGFWERLITITLPLAMPGIISALALGFAHTLGEFGVALMIGGNIPGETQVLSIALFDRIETLEYASAHRLAAGMLIFSLILMLLLYSSRAGLRVR